MIISPAIRIYLSAILIVGISGCDSAWTKHFDTSEAARGEGMIEKGWVPIFIPRDATNLTVSGDPDSNIALGSFVSGNLSHVREACRSAEDSYSIPDYAMRWLDLKSMGKHNAAELRAKGYEILDCETESFGLAYLSTTHEFYYWTSRKK